MSDKDEIKELFQKELGNYQAKVNPNLWNGIQAGLGSAGTAAGVGSSMGLMSKIVIGISIAAAVTVGTVLVVNNEDNSPKTEKTSPHLITEDSVSKVEELKNQEEIKIVSSTKENFSVEENKDLELIQEKNTEYKKQDFAVQNEVVNKDFIKEKASDLSSQNNKVIPEKSNAQTSSSNSVEKKAESIPVVNKTAPKEDFVSELSAVEALVVKQDNQYVTFRTEGAPRDAYVVWNFGDGTIDREMNPEHFYAEAGVYDVTCTVKTETEEITKNIEIEIKISGEIGDLPNAFTPNGDGDNDEFFVNCKNIKSFQLTIIDQQQNIVFSTNDVDFRWNGLDRNGQLAKEGTYYYIIVAEDESGNTINKHQQLRLKR